MQDHPGFFPDRKPANLREPFNPEQHSRSSLSEAIERLREENKELRVERECLLRHWPNSGSSGWLTIYVDSTRSAYWIEDCEGGTARMAGLTPGPHKSMMDAAGEILRYYMARDGHRDISVIDAELERLHNQAVVLQNQLDAMASDRDLLIAHWPEYDSVTSIFAAQDATGDGGKWALCEYDGTPIEGEDDDTEVKYASKHEAGLGILKHIRECGCQSVAATSTTPASGPAESRTPEAPQSPAGSASPDPLA